MILDFLTDAYPGHKGRFPVGRALIRLSILALILVVILFRSAAVQAAEGQFFITIGTGGVTGVYYPAGGATCKILNVSRSEHGVRCSAETTFGSISNIELVRTGELDFGFVQSDWQYHSYNGTSAFQDEGAFEGLRSVLSLHPEVATVVVRADSGFSDFDNLKGRRVNVGSMGSGSFASWNALITRLGWSEDDQRALTNLETSELADALCKGEIDAYFMLIGHPAALIEETQDRCDIRLLGIESSDVDALLEATPYYLRAEVPAGVYGFSEPVGSFGVAATVVTSDRMPEDVVYTLVQAIAQNFDRFKNLHPALGPLDLEDTASTKMAAPLHPGALKFFRERGLIPENGQSQ